MDLGDFHGVRTFLGQAVGQGFTNVLDLGEVAKLITEDLSEDVGTTVKTDGADSDPYGFSSIVPLKWKGRGVEMLQAFLLKSCANEKEKERLGRDLKSGKKVSMVFSERFVNLPAEVASPLLKQLLDDHRNACKEDAVFQTDLVIFSTPVYVEVESALDKELSGGKKAGNKKAKIDKNSGPKGEEVKYYYGEAEMLPGLAEYSWDYKVDQEADRVSDSKRAFTDVGIEGFRRVFVLTWTNFRHFVSQIESYIQ